MKFSLLILLTTLSFYAQAEAPCDVRTGRSIGLDVVEFSSGHIIHSKIPLSQSTVGAVKEEMINLQDMGICEERIHAQKCVLKFEKQSKVNVITLIRGKDRWHSWNISSKVNAQSFVKELKRAGFCS